jgi:hypothetical protein
MTTAAICFSAFGFGIGLGYWSVRGFLVFLDQFERWSK